MRSYFDNYSILPSLFWALVKGLKYQKGFMQKSVIPEIEALRKHNDGSLSEADFQKITDYYAYAVPAILGEAFCMLRGEPMTLRERNALTFLGATTGLFDDFFDEKCTDEQHIKALIDAPSEELARNAHELLFVRFFLRALENTDNIGELKKHCYLVFDAQILSKNQTKSDISKDEIAQITVLKGGVSLLFYRCVMGDYRSENELSMVHDLGSVFQLENDLFDIYKDYLGGIRTLATTETKINNLREVYFKMMNETFSSVQQTPYALRNKKRFSQFISLILFRGLVCLDWLEKSEKRTLGVFSIVQYSRKDLICDMEKAISVVQLLRYYGRTKF